MAGHTLILGAVPGELAPLAARLQHPLARSIGGRRVRCGRIGTIPVRLMITGAGPVNTAQAVTAAVETERPGLIIQTGCAGGFAQSGVGVGDLAVATAEIDLHLGVEAEQPDALPDPLPFAILPEDAAHPPGIYPLSPTLVDSTRRRVEPACRSAGAALHAGPFVTVSTVTASDRRARRIHARHRPVMESMEGAAAAHVAFLYHIPFLEIRAASNLAGRRDRGRWRLETAFTRSAEAVIALLETRFPETSIKGSLP